MPQRKEPKELDMSLQDLADKICQLRATDILVDGGLEENVSCAEMLQRVQYKVEIIMRIIPHPISEAHKNYMKGQRAGKIGSK